MSRPLGTFEFSANFEARIKSTLDARQLVDNFSDLLEFEEANYIPKGFLVSVKGLQNEEERGLYQCIDENNLDLPESWEKVAGEGVGLEILNNQEYFLLTATGDEKNIKGQSQLIFKQGSLGLGIANPDARLEILEPGNKDLLLIKNIEDQGVKITNKGVLKLLEYEELPQPVEGGITYSENSFWLGLKE